MTQLEFTTSPIWLRTLAHQENDPYEGPRTRLRETFLRVREKVEWLVSLISKDMPYYTVHDISHLDALWEIADTIAGDNYPLNPAEAFVLGGSILLHDAGMCLAAYPHGMDDIKATPQWLDSVAMLITESGDEPTAEAIASPAENISRMALQQTLRLLHHKKAHELPIQKWANPKADEYYYLISDEQIRNHYGKLIGQIAESHWWNVTDLTNLTPKQLTPMASLPSSWVVDPVKLACLLRISDAAHIDQRRAPGFLWTLLHPSGEAARHWGFQAKLGKPVLFRRCPHLFFR